MGWDLVEEVASLKKRVAELERWKEALTVIPKSSVKKAAANKGIGDPKPVISFDWTEGLFQGITEVQVERWQRLFPATDVDGEIGKAAAWLAADKRRAKSQYCRFLSGWLTRAQDRGGNRPWKK